MSQEDGHQTEEQRIAERVRQLKAEEERQRIDAEAQRIFLEEKEKERKEGNRIASQSLRGLLHETGMRALIRINELEVPFRWCPSGEFLMGTPFGWFTGQRRHRVRLTRGFWLMETPVTQQMWQALVGSNPSAFSEGSASFFSLLHPLKEGSKNTHLFPVESVSWEQCESFCRDLSKICGIPFSLPTSAEWEYACRAGSTGRFAGSGVLEEMGWFNGNSEGQPHQVGQKKPNAWGLCDMHGNVAEWCQDWSECYFFSREISDPQGPSQGLQKVIRGGSWRDAADFCQSGHFLFLKPKKAKPNLGFRMKNSI